MALLMEADASTPVGEFAVTERYRQFVVWSLCFVYLVNQADRQIFSVLQQPIKEAFRLTDGQLGLVGGTAFALFYVTVGIPIARRADNGNRIRIIAVSLALWSLFTALTSLAQNFWQLLIARMFVGVGEAGCNPPSYSIISDYFGPKRRATAISIYSMGASGGTIVGLIVGTQVAQAYGWRAAFLVMGLPGLIVAALVKKYLAEPPRGLSDPSRQQSQTRTFGAVLKLLWSRPTFRNLAFATAFVGMVVYGIGSFFSVWLIRKHHLSLVDAGLWIAMASVLGGLTGTFFGGRIAGVLADRKHDPRWLMWVPMIALAINVPAGLFLYAAVSKLLVFVLLTFNIAVGISFLAPTITATQGLVVAHERAMAGAVMLFVLNLIGLGLGPLLTGHLSDRWRSYFLEHGEGAAQASADGITRALIWMLLAAVLAIIFYWRAAGTARDELIY
jgi:MFS family permease